MGVNLMKYKSAPEPVQYLNDILFDHEKRHKKPAYGLEYPEFKARTAAKRFINLILEPITTVDQCTRDYNPKYSKESSISDEPFYIYSFPWLDNACYLLKRYLKLSATDQSIIFEATAEGVHWRGESMKHYYSGKNSIYNIVMDMRASNLTAE